MLLIRLRRMLFSTGFIFALLMSLSTSSVPVGVQLENRCCHITHKRVGLMLGAGCNDFSHINRSDCDAGQIGTGDAITKMSGIPVAVSKSAWNCFARV